MQQTPKPFALLNIRGKYRNSEIRKEEGNGSGKGGGVNVQLAPCIVPVYDIVAP